MTQRIGSIEVRHEERKAGASGYTLRRLMRLWLSAWVNFSVLPLRVATVLGLVLAAAGLVGEGKKCGLRTGEACRGGIDVFLTHVVSDDGHPQGISVGRDVVEQRGLASAQKAGQHSDGQASWGHGVGCARR